jgi:hypothetical protein
MMRSSGKEASEIGCVGIYAKPFAFDAEQPKFLELPLDR